MDEFICDFLLHFNLRFYLITKVSPYKAMMNASDKELKRKIRKKS